MIHVDSYFMDLELWLPCGGIIVLDSVNWFWRQHLRNGDMRPFIERQLSPCNQRCSNPRNNQLLIANVYS
jgi:hypothetical protein